MDISYYEHERVMSTAQDLCAFCHHQRVGHKNDLGDQNSTCSWPNCNCKEFIE
jgi:hypothetical protein